MIHFEFDLGQTVKNIVHNIKGVISARSESLTGCKRYLIAYKTKWKKVEEWYGEAELKFVKDAPAEFKRRKNSAPFRFENGALVRDMITKTEIVLMNRTQFSPGYNRYTGYMQNPKEAKDADHMLHFDEGQLVHVGDGIMTEAQIQAVKAVKEEAERNPAGPPRVEIN